MSKERELLRRALVYLSGLPARSSIQDEIEAYLSAEEGKQEEEPVAWRVKRVSHGVESVHYTDDPPNRRSELKEMGFVFEPLFLHPSYQEPVACSVDVSEAYHAVDKFLRNNLDDEDYSLLSNALETIFLHPAPSAEKREPLSEEEIADGYCDNGRGSWISFEAGVRFAEKHHGIGGGDE